MGVLLVAMAAHATLGKLLYAFNFPRGTGADPEELHQAAMWMYYWGDLAEATLVVALMLAWLRRRRRLSDFNEASPDLRPIRACLAGPIPAVGSGHRSK